MKLKQIWKEGKISLGIDTAHGVVDVTEEAARRGIAVPATMIEAIRGGEQAIALLKQLAADAVSYTDAPMAPAVTGCEKVLCIGLNYRQHAKECNLAMPDAPVLFNKFANSLAGDNDKIYLDPAYREYDYEAELVAIIGKTARNVTAAEALDHVFGYTCGNDLSVRDLQFARGGQWIMGKSMDGFGPIGPCVVTADEIDPTNLRITCSVNSETRQDSNTSDMIFSVAQIIEDLSRHMTLVPGDLIFTGTPQGVVHGYPADKKNWLKPGDQVNVTIEHIGTLHNTMC